MKKSLKSFIAIVLSLLMIATALPLSVFATEVQGTLTNAATGIYMYDTSDNNKRFSASSSGHIEIANDGEDKNFSVAYYKYDVTEIADRELTVTSAPFSVEVKSNPLEDCQGLTFFYTNNNKADSFPSGMYKSADNQVFGSTGMHLVNFKSVYNLQPIQSFAKSELSANRTLTVNIADAINSAVASGRTYCVIMIAQSAAGSTGSGGGWSDCILKYSTPTVTFTAETGDDYTMSETVSPNKIGMITADSGRYDSSSKDFNIVNDTQDNNFSIGFWSFNISSLVDHEGNLTSAPFTVTMPSQTSDNREWNGLTFWYSANDVADSLSAGVNNDSNVNGSSGGHLSRAINRYDLHEVLVVPSEQIIATGTRFDMDLKDAIEARLAAGKTTLTIMVTHSRAGNNGAPWTDVHLNGNVAPLVCNYEKEEELPTEADAIINAISAYEAKMAEIATSSVPYMYTNMAEAYRAYTAACRCRDAALYGDDEDALEQLPAKAQALTTATRNMTKWTNRVSAKASAIPTFPNDTVSEMQEYKGKFIDNIIYTTNVTEAHNHNDDNPKGYAAMGWYEGRLYVCVFYPTATVVLYDGITTPKIPVMMSARNQWINEDTCVYTVYPATNASGNEDREDIYMINKYNRMNDPSYSWVGSGYDHGGSNCVSCDFNLSQNNHYHTVGVDSNNSVKGFSCPMNNYWTKGNYRKHQFYSSALIIDDNFDFNGNGKYKWDNLYWYFKGGNRNHGGGTFDGSTNNEDNWIYNMTMTAAETEHAIYAINYKAILTALSSNSIKNKLSNVGAYKSGSLEALLTALDDAASYDPTNVDYTNTQSAVNSVGQAIENKVSAIETAMANATADVDDYEDLRSAITRTRMTFANGNADNENYTAESWAPFLVAYTNAQTEMANLLYRNYKNTVDEELNLTFSEKLALVLNNAYDALVMNKDVVDTSILDIILSNAATIAEYSIYFNAQTIQNSNIASLVESCKEDIWGSVEGFGLDVNKLDNTPDNQLIVNGYVTQLANAVSQILMDKTAIVPGTGMSLVTAIEAAQGYESTKADYANYATLETALNNGLTLMTTSASIDPYVENHAYNLVSRYIEYVQAIETAIRQLAPSFSKVTNGTIANTGRIETTAVQSAKRPNMWGLYWYHNTDITFFKTERAASDGLEGNNPKWELPRSEMMAYCWQTGGDYSMILDSLNLSSSTDTATGEFHKGEVFSAASFPNCALNQAEIDSHQGNLTVTASNITVSLESFNITKTSKAPYLGVDANGNQINDLRHDFYPELSTTQGSFPATGGILALNGETYFDVKTTISVPATTGAPNKTNKPSQMVKRFNSNEANTMLGFLAFWRFADNAFAKSNGYLYEHNLYNLKINVVDLCTLLDLIEAVENMSGDANQYSNNSWNNLNTMLGNAKMELDYNTMDYDTLMQKLDKRYDDLYNAREALEAPARNTSLANAIAAAAEIYANDEERCSPDSWAAFAEAYRSANSAYTGDYSDTGVRNFGTSEQSKIDALAQALVTAKNNLDYLIDFSVVDKAANQLIQGIEGNKYTKESINSVKASLAALPNLNMSDSNRQTHYESEEALNASVANEAQNIIPSLADDLVEADAAVEVLDAAKDDAKMRLGDPDAFNPEEIQQILNQLSAYQTVEFPNYVNHSQTLSVSCAQYANQNEADAAVRDALTVARVQEYTVKRINPDNTQTVIGTYPYGTTVTVNSADGSNVDWNYQSTSNTTISPTTIFSTGAAVTFVVKGNTVLTTSKATGEGTKRVVFANSVNGKAYDIRYVPAGTVINLADEAANAPDYAYYTFKNFAVSTVDNAKTGSITVNGDIKIYAVYEFNTSTNAKYNMTVFGVSPYIPVVFGETTEDIETNVVMNGGEINSKLNYNTRVDFKDETYCYQGDEYFDLAYKVGGEDKVVEYMGRDVSTSGDPYAWIKLSSKTADYLTVADAISNAYCLNYATFSESCIEEILDAVPDIKADVIFNGPDYSFYAHEEGIIAVVGADEYAALAEAGIITKDYSILTSDKLRVNSDYSVSVVSSYCVPAGGQFVERGLIYTTDASSVTDADMTLAAVPETDSLKRVKSTKKTVGNQYVITMGLGGSGTYNIKYRAYFTYTLNGETYTRYSDIYTPQVIL